MKHFIGIMSLAFFLASCKNSYESKLVGSYIIDSFESVDKTKGIDSSVLELSSDRTFLITFRSKRSFRGEWKAGDDGDRTWIEFDFNGGKTEGNVGGEGLNYIYLYNPSNFGYSSLKTLSFKRS